jgi:hypothetical protein
MKNTGKLTLRQEIAMRIFVARIGGLMSNPTFYQFPYHKSAQWSVEAADALLKELKAKK